MALDQDKRADGNVLGSLPHHRPGGRGAQPKGQPRPVAQKRRASRRQRAGAANAPSASKAARGRSATLPRQGFEPEEEELQPSLPLALVGGVFEGVLGAADQALALARNTFVELRRSAITLLRRPPLR